MYMYWRAVSGTDVAGAGLVSELGWVGLGPRDPPRDPPPADPRWVGLRGWSQSVRAVLGPRVSGLGSVGSVGWGCVVGWGSVGGGIGAVLGLGFLELEFLEFVELAVWLSFCHLTPTCLSSFLLCLLNMAFSWAISSAFPVFPGIFLCSLFIYCDFI